MKKIIKISISITLMFFLIFSFSSRIKANELSFDNHITINEDLEDTSKNAKNKNKSEEKLSNVAIVSIVVGGLVLSSSFGIALYLFIFNKRKT